MKILFLILTFLNLAHAQHAHPDHGFLMFGENEVFFSHVVYKAPHNYQVLLRGELSGELSTVYSKLRTTHTTEQIRFVLRNTDISGVPQSRDLIGDLVSINNGQRITVLKGGRLSNIEVLYFNELPLDLGSHH